MWKIQIFISKRNDIDKYEIYIFFMYNLNALKNILRNLYILLFFKYFYFFE